MSTSIFLKCATGFSMGIAIRPRFALSCVLTSDLFAASVVLLWTL